MSFYSRCELKNMGFKNVGENVRLSKLASIYGASNISLDDNTRIDDFCILSSGEGGIYIGRHVHISAYASIIGAGTVTLEDYTCISGRCSIYSSNDDYSGNFMTNSTVPNAYRNVSHSPVTIKKHSLIGAGSIVLPGVIVGECSAVGALSLVNKPLEPGYIYAGVPVRKISKRKRDLERYEDHLCLKN
ncbi:acyltransferase [Vibrio breoganii]